jgi:hypothetical protein
MGKQNVQATEAKGEQAVTHSDITRRLSEFMEQLPADTDLESVTMRKIKEGISPHFAPDKWDSILEESKDFLKEAARRQLELTAKARQSHPPAKKRKVRKEKDNKDKDKREKEKKEKEKTDTKNVASEPTPHLHMRDACQVCKLPGKDDDKTLLV